MGRALDWLVPVVRTAGMTRSWRHRTGLASGNMPLSQHRSVRSPQSGTARAALLSASNFKTFLRLPDASGCASSRMPIIKSAASTLDLFEDTGSLRGPDGWPRFAISSRV
jgi:hypothetical protein